MQGARAGKKSKVGHHGNHVRLHQGVGDSTISRELTHEIGNPP